MAVVYIAHQFDEIHMQVSFMHVCYTTTSCLSQTYQGDSTKLIFVLYSNHSFNLVWIDYTIGKVAYQKKNYYIQKFFDLSGSSFLFLNPSFV